jgi:hypothetical protein
MITASVVASAAGSTDAQLASTNAVSAQETVALPVALRQVQCMVKMPLNQMQAEK